MTQLDAQPSPEEIAELQTIACTVAREAGALIVDERPDHLGVAATKSTATDVVTVMDKRSEELLHSRLAQIRPGDGLALTDAWITAPVKCAPPQNKPTPAERDTCATFLHRELTLLAHARVFVPLGQLGYDATCRFLGVRPRPRFAHGVEVAAGTAPDGADRWIVGSYHVSQQNTFTGTLTEPMLDAVLLRARELAGS